MKKISITLVLLIFQALLFSQNDIKNSDIIGCWKIYSEENKFFKNSTVYRPCDYHSIHEKKRKWYRYSIIFRNDGTCSYTSPGKNDIPKMKEGFWNYDENSSEIQILNVNNEIITAWKVKQLETDLLLISNKKL